MGYSVPEHFHALNRLGPTIHHRRSFAPVAAFYGETGVELTVTDLPLAVRVVTTCGFLPRSSADWRAEFRRKHRCVGGGAASSPRGGFGAMHIDVLVRRTAAHAPAHAVLDHGGAAGGAVDARAGAVLCGAARPAAAGAGDRPRIPVRHRIRSAAGVLARGDRLPPGRHDRRLFAVAALHRRRRSGRCSRSAAPSSARRMR